MGNATNYKDSIVVKNAAGDLEVIDLTTGEVIQSDQGEITPLSVMQFSYDKALLICQQVREGKTMAEIAAQSGMPPIHVISHWQRTDRMFAETLKIARKERADVYFDKAMEIAENAAHLKYHKDEVAGVKLASDLYKWGASKSNPERFGEKVTHEGSTEKPILMRVINTGISRAPRPVVDAEVIPTEEVTNVIEQKTGDTDSGSGEDQEDKGASD